MHQKLMFALCRKCCETLEQNDCNHEETQDRTFSGEWTSLDLKKAVELGYEILKIYEIWHYEETSEELYNGYVNMHLKNKLEASGYPKWCKNDTDRLKHLRTIEESEGITLDPEKIILNPGKRYLSKMFLNSLWGKHGERDNQGTTEVVKNYAYLLELATSIEKELCSVVAVNEEIFYCRWRYTEGHEKPQPTANVVIAAYTTSHARLKLYECLEELGERVIYCDTDSCIYVTSESAGHKRMETGECLQQLSDELSEYGNGSYIRDFVSCGPKFYSYIVVKADGKEKTITKIKGVSLNYSTKDIYTHDSIKELALGKKDKIKHCFTSIRRDPLRNVITKKEEKTCKANHLKRRHVDVKYSYPYGYKKPRVE